MHILGYCEERKLKEIIEIQSTGCSLFLLFLLWSKAEQNIRYPLASKSPSIHGHFYMSKLHMPLGNMIFKKSSFCFQVIQVLISGRINKFLTSFSHNN